MKVSILTRLINFNGKEFQQKVFNTIKDKFTVNGIFQSDKCE